ncbi:MAG: site-2 protease family protein [Candidatus Pacebacteria bacterium]|nr:site-2 protease family protein [Candidatus Paceibacterota bacterium]MBP9716124.1 site-2 protease family protein [Candidatus Paceibacterota bacterium]
MQFTSSMDGLFYVIVLIMSVIIHEFSHGYAAYLLGDHTARLSGRLTLNPLKHLDPFGSVILPLLLIFSNAGFVIGWARPVPYNPDNLRKGRWSNVIVAGAGVLANIFVAIVFGLFIRFAYVFGLPVFNPMDILPFYKISMIIVMINIVLAFFNMIPIPPLDGSKILFSFLPARLRYIETFLEQWGIFILLFFILFIWGSIAPYIFVLFNLITGI